MGGHVGGDRTSVEPSRVRFSRTHRAASVSGREILIIRAGPRPEVPGARNLCPYHRGHVGDGINMGGEKPEERWINERADAQGDQGPVP